MSFTKGDLFHIEMRNGIFQVLERYGADDTGNIYYFRKVFDGKLKLKVSKAETVHESWMSPLSDKTKDKLSETLAQPEVQAILQDLTIDRMMQFETDLRVEILLCSMDPKNKKALERQLNAQMQGNVNPFLLRNAIRELHGQGQLQIETNLACPTDGKRMYRVELGRYCDDFDEFGAKRFREVRFAELKIYRREEFV